MWTKRELPVVAVVDVVLVHIVRSGRRESMDAYGGVGSCGACVEQGFRFTTGQAVARSIEPIERKR